MTKFLPAHAVTALLSAALLCGFADRTETPTFSAAHAPGEEMGIEIPLTDVDATEFQSQDAAGAEGAASDVVAEGRASYYGKRFAGRPTASGEPFDPTQLTAAHRTLPFGTIVRVTLSRTGESVDVRINDRGPFHGKRVIDVSRAAAERIGLVGAGVADVVVTRLASS